jgi:glycosyltransferase involved in cell wall biosynthesis
MRILHVLTRYLRGGSEGNIKRSIHWEVSQGHTAAVALGAGASDSEALADLHALCAVYDVPGLLPHVHPLQDSRAFKHLNQIIRRGPFDVVCTHQSKAGILGRAAAAGTGAVVVHSVHMPSFGRGYRPSDSAIFWCAERYCARLTDWYLFVGEELRRQYVRAGLARPERTRVVRSPIDIDRFASARDYDGDLRTQLRASLGLRREGVVLIAIGALEPRKRHDLLIRRLSPLLTSGHAQLVIAGDGPMATDLRRSASTLGAPDAVRLVGHVTDVETLLAAADVFVHSSRVEGVPQVVIQALAAGLPVVATDVCGLREVPGADVSIVPGDGHGFAGAVKRVLSRPAPRQPISLGALADWRPESGAAQVTAFYDRLLPRSSTVPIRAA